MISNDAFTMTRTLSFSNENSPALQVIEISSDSEEDVFTHARSTWRGEHGHPFPSTIHSNDVIELTDSDSEKSLELPDMLSPWVKEPWRKKPADSKQPISSDDSVYLYADSSDNGVSDGDCVLELNDPPGSRKPMRGKSPVNGQGVVIGNPPLDSPKKNSIPGSSRTPVKSPSKKAGRLALRAKEHSRLQEYASELFAKLNKDIFGDRLPKDTSLEWSKRLLTTAGRARWHRSREGGHSTRIELASKILDNDERVRNTLSHEMCHLACWVIDNQPKEGHGQLFKSWAHKVMHKHPDIHISTRHSYDISYPYEWRCERCSKIYGRYSKSIKPDECVCGACKMGKLIPLFVERKRMTPKVSCMAVAKPRDSPSSIAESPTKTCPTMLRTSRVDKDTSSLANAIGNISITDW